jgi:RNA polymerase sigma factor (sigma-70 family)
VALAVARAKYPGLSDEDHLDIVQEAIANVLARLRRGPIADERSYLLRLVYTCGAHVLRERMRPTVSLDVDEGGHAVEAQVDRSSAPASAEEQMLRDAEAREPPRIIETELSEDEAAALLMRTVDRMTPAEIADAMGWSRRRYRKLLERGGRKLNAGLERERGRELLVLYVAGAASDRERAAAEALLATDDGARLLASIRRRLDAAA